MDDYFVSRSFIYICFNLIWYMAVIFNAINMIIIYMDLYSTSVPSAYAPGLKSCARA